MESRSKVIHSFQRWKCVCAYDGTNYAGWQKQPNGKAVQDAINKGLAEIKANGTFDKILAKYGIK